MSRIPSREEISTSFGRKASMAILVSTIGFGVAFVGSVIVARLFGVDGKGTLSLFLATVTGISTFASLGIDKGQMYFASRTETKLEMFLSNGIVLSLVLGGSAGCFYFLLDEVIDLRSVSMGRFGLLAVMVLIPIELILRYQKQYLVTIHQYTFSRTSMAIQQALPLVAATALYVTGELSIDYLVLAVAVGMVCLVLFIHELMKVVLHINPYTKRSFSFSFARESLSFGIRHYLSELALFLVNRLDFFLVAWFLGRSALGIYSVAVAMAEIILRIPRELGVILFPVFASNSLQKGQAATFLRRMNAIALVTAILLWIVSKPTIVALFGVEFSESVEVFKWLLPGALAWSTIEITWSRVSAGGRPGLGVPIFGLVAVVDGALNVVLLPRIGVVGGAVAATISYVMAAGVFLHLFMRSERCGIRETLLIRVEDLSAIRDALRKLLPKRPGSVRS